MAGPGGIGIVQKTAEDVPQSLADRAATPFEALKRRREQLAAAQTREFLVPGYVAFTEIDGDPADLVARYERLSVEDYRNALIGPADSDDHRNAQFLIDALDGLFWRVGERLLPLIDPEDGDAGWHDLAQHLLDDPVTNATEQILDGVFAGDSLALADHAAEVARWMEEGHREADEEFLGGR